MRFPNRLRLLRINAKTARSCWALAKVGHADKELFDRLSSEIVARQFAHFGSSKQNFSNILWAMGTLDYKNPVFLDAFFKVSGAPVLCWLTRHT